MAMLINTALKRPIANSFDRLYEQTRNPFFQHPGSTLCWSLLAISWPGVRLIRSQVLSISGTTYVEGAKASGATTRRISVAPHCAQCVGTLDCFGHGCIGGAIVLESSLSFLGVGIQPPNASWGSMLSDSLKLWRTATSSHVHTRRSATISSRSPSPSFGDGLNDVELRQNK